MRLKHSLNNSKKLHLSRKTILLFGSKKILLTGHDDSNVFQFYYEKKRRVNN